MLQQWLNFNAPNDSADLECDTSKIPVDLTEDPFELPDEARALRVLIGGRSAAGKSTLLGSVFGWTPKKASRHSAHSHRQHRLTGSGWSKP